MIELFLIIISAALVNNFVLVKFLGLCPLLGVSKQLTSAYGMTIASAFVLTLTAGMSYLLNQYVLVPLSLEYLRIIAFIVTIAAVVQLTDLLTQALSPLLHQVLGIFLPLITTNCAVLGLALLNVYQAHHFIQSLFYGLGTALGFGLVLILFAGIRERLQLTDVPRVFQGSAIAMITAGIMSLAFMGFMGL